MFVIEDKGKLSFYEGKKELTLDEGFERLDSLFINETAEVQKVIDNLKNKYDKRKKENNH